MDILEDIEQAWFKVAWESTSVTIQNDVAGMLVRKRRLIRPGTAQRVERTVHRDAVRPRAELRIAAITRQRAKDLNPDLLRDVGGKVRIADQPPNDRVDVRSMLRPNRAQRPLIAGDCQCDRVVRGHA